MIDLRISGADEAPEIIRSWPATKAVSLLGKKDAHRVPCQGEHHLVVFFDDTEHVDDKQWTAVSPWHIQRVLEHTADLQSGDRLLVHCKAGKSRSTAMAIAILIQHGMSPTEAFLRVKVVRPILIPNRLMIEFIDQHFNLDGELEAIVAEYYEGLTLPGVKLPDRGGWNL
jgi:predicted protein tyrosine phosphatase